MHVIENHDTRKHSRLLGTAAVAVWAVVIVGAFGAIAFYARLILPTDQMAAVITSSLVRLANDDRQDRNLGGLTTDPLLVAAAQAKADDMAKKGYFAHTSPDGRTSWSWFRDAGYAFSHAGENLAVNFSDSGDVEQAWMNSPTHRANILNGNFTEVGIATAVGEYQGKKTVFVVQMFGTPAQTAAQAPVREVIPENPGELAVIERTPVVLGTEVAEQPKEGEAAAAVAPAAEPAKTITIQESGPVMGTAPQPAIQSLPELVPAPATLAGSPKSLLRTLYLLAALVLIVIFGSITRLELRRHHMRHVFATVFLFVLMGGLFLAADRFLFPTPVVGQTLTQP